MASAVKSLFFSRVDSFLEATYSALGVLPSICEALHKYDLFHHFERWHSEGIFHSYNNWKLLVKSRIREKEVSDWKIFSDEHPNMQITQAVFDHLTPSKFCSITDHYPDLVSWLHIQIGMGNFGLNAGVPWLHGTPSALCFICKEGLDDVNHFLWECKAFREIFSPYGPIYSRKLFQLTQQMAYRYQVLSVVSIASTKPSCCLAVFLSRLIRPLTYWSRSFCAQRLGKSTG